MKNNFVAKQEIVINAPISKVWNALINPELIKQYLFGTEAVSDWKEGSSITYKGKWEGKNYEDKGMILKLIPEKIFESTYWSSMSGLADSPENYNKVTYQLTEIDGKTKVTLTQDNNPTEEAKAHSEKNWEMVLDTLKKLLEN
jgi:uncharacterized protein YndB with AHSA1/START domain